MVLPEDGAQPEDQAQFLRAALLLLGEIRDYNRRVCEAIEALVPRNDPRRKASDLYRDRG